MLLSSIGQRLGESFVTNEPPSEEIIRHEFPYQTFQKKILVSFNLSVKIIKNFLTDMIEVITFGNEIDLEIQSVELITNKHYPDFPCLTRLMFAHKAFWNSNNVDLPKYELATSAL
jgi:hypothetical protein